MIVEALIKGLIIGAILGLIARCRRSAVDIILLLAMIVSVGILLIN